MKLGVLGGTFDPVHNGHLAIAREVRVRLALDEVLFVPAGCPWLKAARPVSPAERRIEMLRLALEREPHFRLSTLEIDRGGPTYTIDTIRELKERLGSGDELYFILGADSLSELPKWRQPETIIRLCTLVAVPRPGYSFPDLAAMEKAIPGIGRRVIWLDAPNIDISATEIRDRLARGESIKDLVPGPVADYIREQGLYRD